MTRPRGIDLIRGRRFSSCAAAAAASAVNSSCCRYGLVIGVGPGKVALEL